MLGLARLLARPVQFALELQQLRALCGPALPRRAGIWLPHLLMGPEKRCPQLAPLHFRPYHPPSSTSALSSSASSPADEADSESDSIMNDGTSVGVHGRGRGSVNFFGRRE